MSTDRTPEQKTKYVNPIPEVDASKNLLSKLYSILKKKQQKKIKDTLFAKWLLEKQIEEYFQKEKRQLLSRRNKGGDKA